MGSVAGAGRAGPPSGEPPGDLGFSPCIRTCLCTTMVCSQRDTPPGSTHDMPTLTVNPSQDGAATATGGAASSGASGDDDLELLLQRFLVSIAALAGAQAGAVRVLTDDGLHMRLVAQQGLPLHVEEAERLADKLVIRDREGDDRRLCLECAHLHGAGRWRCGNWDAADVAREGLAPDLVKTLQRCSGYPHARNNGA